MSVMSETDLQAEFNALVFATLQTNVDFKINERLRDLREFLFRNHELLGREDFRAFFDKWIAPNEIAIEWGAAGNWDEVSMLEMQSDLEALKVGD